MQNIRTSVFFGDLVRNLHRWGAHLMVFTVTLHMARVFYTGAYKPPREFNWVVGVVLLFLTLGLSFTGYLLPWDQLAIWAVTVGTSLAGYSPFIAKQANFLLLGGVIVGPDTLLRWYVLHVLALPFVLVIFLVGPLLADPQGRRHLGTALEEKETMARGRHTARPGDLRPGPGGGARQGRRPTRGRGPRALGRRPRGRGRSRARRRRRARAPQPRPPPAPRRAGPRRRRSGSRTGRGRRSGPCPRPPLRSPPRRSPSAAPPPRRSPRPSARRPHPPATSPSRRRARPRSTGCSRSSRPRASSASNASRATGSTCGRTC